MPAPAVRFLQYLIVTGKTGEQAMRSLSCDDYAVSSKPKKRRKNLIS
jgi:hypothetical protein